MGEKKPKGKTPEEKTLEEKELLVVRHPPIRRRHRRRRVLAAKRRWIIGFLEEMDKGAEHFAAGRDKSWAAAIGLWRRDLGRYCRGGGAA